jgi:putative heme transporter
MDGWRVVEMVASVLLAAALLAWGLPLVAGADWADIRGVLGALSSLQVGALTAVWLAGLWVHTIALAAAMPGLSHRRAFFLNLTGSSVSNMLPLGGAAGTALNYTTSRAWGFSTGAFLRWALVTNIWDTLGKLVVPGVALVWLAFDSTEPPEALVGAAVGALVLLVVLVALTWLVLHREFGARVVGRLLDWAVGRLRLPVPEDGGYAGRAQEFRRDLSALIAAAWWRLSLGKAGYAVFQALLLWLCLSWLGGEVSPATAFAVFAAERVLSLAVITPGATGVVEIGMAGMLVAFGVTPAVAAAGVLLYRAFIVGFEIPAGAAAMLWWLIRRGHARRVEAQGQP